MKQVQIPHLCDMLQLSVVMNGITHGLGVILCVIGTMMMRQRVADLSANTRIRYVKKGGRIIEGK